MAYPGKEENDKRVPDTTQKKDGTTSAYSAATTRNEDKEEIPHFSTGQQGRAAHHPGNTTQGGSNFGQGSAALGPSSYKQDSERSKGTNYDNEAEKFSETGTAADGTTNARLQGGTEAERDEYDGAKRRDADQGNDTAGIP